MALPQGDAYRLLNELVGDRASVDAEATRALAERCARLPLALRLAAELAVSRPGASIRTLLDDLEGTDALDEFDTSDDPQTSLRAVFSWSYQQLRLMRPARSVSSACTPAAVTTPTPWPHSWTARWARPRLDPDAHRAHLLEQFSNGRVTMHDLLHAYAVELAQLEPTADQALARLLDYFVYVAAHAGDVVHPYRDRRDRPAQR